MQVIYNVTVNIDATCEQEWVDWMRSVHIPQVMQKGSFLESRLLRLHGEEEGGVTYAIMYLAHNQQKLDEYATTHAPTLQADHVAKFGGKFAAFRSTLSVIEHFNYEG